MIKERKKEREKKNMFDGIEKFLYIHTHSTSLMSTVLMVFPLPFPLSQPSPTLVPGRLVVFLWVGKKKRRKNEALKRGGGGEKNWHEVEWVSGE